MRPDPTTPSAPFDPPVPYPRASFQLRPPLPGLLRADLERTSCTAQECSRLRQRTPKPAVQLPHGHPPIWPPARNTWTPTSCTTRKLAVKLRCGDLWSNDTRAGLLHSSGVFAPPAAHSQAGDHPYRLDPTLDHTPTFSENASCPESSSSTGVVHAGQLFPSVWPRRAAITCCLTRSA